MRILGIDIGHQSIKAVELDTAFGRYEIHEYHEQVLPIQVETTETRPDRYKDPVASLLSSLARKPDRVVIALPTGRVTFRNLTIPTKDKKSIGSAVAFELDDELPFAIAQSTYDYATLAQTKQGVLIHVAATLSKHIEEELQTWRNLDLDPDVITTEPWSFRTFINRTLSPELREKPVMIAQVGEERTTLYIHHKTTPIIAREISWGGRDLTLAIATHYGIPFDQAEKAKLDHGFVISPAMDADATREQSEFSLTLIQPIQNFIAELKQASLTCKNLTHQALGSIYLTGGSSLLPGFHRVVQDSLQLPVNKIQALSSLSTSGVAYSEQADAKFLLAASLAMTQVGPDRNVLINLRKGAFSRKTKTKELNLSAIKRPLLAASAIAVCFFLSLGFQSYLYKSRLKETDSQLEKSVHSFFGQISSTAIRNYLSSPSTLKQKVNAEITKQKELGKLLNPNARLPLDFLRDLSSSIPKDIVVDMTQIQVGAAPATPFMKSDDQTASATFVVANQQMIDRLANIVSTKLTGMTKSKVEEVHQAAGTPTKYKITFSGKPAEDSYGK